MDTEDVWQLVAQARADLAENADDANAVAHRMAELLAQRPADEIRAFAQPFWDLLAQSYRADLWAAAYVINGGASDDGFDYFRGWLIAQGQTVFREALADPDGLAELPAVLSACAKGDDLSAEAVLGVAWDAHLSATGGRLPLGAFTIRYPGLASDWAFDFDDESEMRHRLPRLTALCYGPAN